MTRWNREPLRAVAGGALAITLFSTTMFGQAPTPPPKPAEEEYMNIQVLKGVPADQVVPAMQFITTALGVDCEYCHVKGSFDKDDLKPKQTARKMMAMVSAINTANFGGHREVTCFTCHHGVTEVAAVPIIPDVEPKEEEPAPKPANLPAAASLLDKYAQAVGGAAAFAKIETRVQKGTLAGPGGRSSPVEIYSKAPDKRASYVQMGQGTSITAFDGTSGWLGNPGRPPRDMSPAEAAAARIDADLRFPVDVKTMFQSFEVHPAAKIGEHDVLLVAARNEGQPPVRLYFDTASGLLVRLVRYIETPLGRNPTQIDYDDYRDADGVKIPFKWTLARPQGRFTIKVDETKTNVPVDDSKFAKPAEAPKPEAPKPGGSK